MRSSSASIAPCGTTLRRAGSDRPLRWSLWAVFAAALQLPAASFQLPASSSQLPVSSSRLPVSSSRRPAFSRISHPPPPTSVSSRSVTFRTDDGVTLSGTWYEPSTRTGPAVILVHMLHRTHSDWDALATRLAAEGIGALAFDLRGHGESTGAIPADGQFAAFQQDLAAARRYVSTRSDVLLRRLGIAGASLGAALAVLDAAQSTAVTSIALLAVSPEFRGVRR